MGFGTDLQGRESHDALLQIQDTEIRLLENMKSCLNKRIEGDRKYIQSLASFVQTAQKIEATEYHEYCSLFKVIWYCNLILILSFWKDRSGQTIDPDQTARLLKEQSDQVHTVCHSVCIFRTHYLMIMPPWSSFRMITANFSDFYGSSQGETVE